MLVVYKTILFQVQLLFRNLGHEGDGDIYKPKNITSLEKYVMKMTEQKGIDFVMADGVSKIINNFSTTI